MAVLSKLKVEHLRNIQSLDLLPNKQVNLLIGENGSGKTSLLEAIYLLAMGRSFRTRIAKPVISFGEEDLLLYAEKNSGEKIGVRKNTRGDTVVRVNGETLRSLAPLAELIPLQLINQDIYQLIEGGPLIRRQFLDWGVFHMEHDYHALWRRFRKVLEQRNAALKQRLPDKQVVVWDKDLVSLGEKISMLRQSYLGSYQPMLADLLSENDEPAIALSYHQGWKHPVSYGEILHSSLKRDKLLGYTEYGPHRADFQLNVPEKGMAKNILSRGQKKVLLCLMKLAQGMFLHKQKAKTPIYLVDDISAELDAKSRNKVLFSLLQMRTQVFITAIDRSSLNNIPQGSGASVFHVEHGHVLV